MVKKKMRNTIADTTLYIDGHIHFYDNFSPEMFFKFAKDNFSKYNKNNEKNKNILLFSEGKQNDFFSSFKNNKDIYNNIGYSFVGTDEDNSLLVKKDNVELFYIIQGRQIVTKENIEILSIGTTDIIEDGKPAINVIDELMKQKKPAVLTWGFGKWLFKREKIVYNLIKDKQSPYLFIGDNSARPVFWGTPKLYKYAKKKDYKIINGSDPLPLSSEENKPASFGFYITGEFDKNKPAESLIKLLIQDELKINFFGKRDGIIKFFSRQIKMFLKKHF